MTKLIIDTQIAENYAAHEGFTGEYRWKFKGGNTYVVDNITEAQQARIERDGIPTLERLLNEDGDSYREYVISTRIVADDAPECEEWETPYRLSYEDKRWIARRVIKNDEYGYMRREIAFKTESYVLGEAGERLNYSSSWTLRNGTTAYSDNELRTALDMMEAI